MSRFAGKRAIVFGGTSGINLGIAQRLAEEGARVFLVSRSQDRVDRAVAAIRAIGGYADGQAADVRDYALVEAAVAMAASTGEIDIVVSGAAGNFIAQAAEMSSNAFRTVVEIDLIGTFNTARASIQSMRRPGSSFIAISAPQAMKPVVGQAHACSAKAAVNMLVKCLALEWAPAGVRVNAISPGPIAGTEGMRRLTATDEETAILTRSIPLQRYGSIAEVASAACYLASDEAAYVTGVVLDVDGGTSLGLGGLV